MFLGVSRIFGLHCNVKRFAARRSSPTFSIGSSPRATDRVRQVPDVHREKLGASVSDFRIMLKVLGLSLYGPQAASARYRLLQYSRASERRALSLMFTLCLRMSMYALFLLGRAVPTRKIIRYYLDRAFLLAKQRDYDVAIVNGELFPYLPGMLESRVLRLPYIYDLDDAFFIKYRLDRFKRVSFLLRDKFRPVISRATAVTAGSHYLARHAVTWNSATHWLPTVVDTERYVSLPKKTESFYHRMDRVAVDLLLSSIAFTATV